MHVSGFGITNSFTCQPFKPYTKSKMFTLNSLRISLTCSQNTARYKHPDMQSYYPKTSLLYLYLTLTAELNVFAALHALLCQKTYAIILPVL